MPTSPDNKFDVFNDYYEHVNKFEGGREINAENMQRLLTSNGLIPNKSKNWYTSFNRFGGIDPINTANDNREFLFFTKPDLNIFKSSTGSYGELQLHDQFATNTIFNEAFNRYKDVLIQLEYSAKDSDDRLNPFMNLLSNACVSRLDLPGITAEAQESSSNIYGTSIMYRGHSLKSDNGFDFSLTFQDTPYLEIYMLAKIYDEYARSLKLGMIENKRQYIIDRILPDQFSCYKFIVGSDGETILYFAKITGIYITDVPRTEFSDMPQDGLRISLSFHGQFVEDSDPVIIHDFNRVSPASTDTSTFSTLYNNDTNNVDNSWIKYPIIIEQTNNRRAALRLGKDYKLKWTNERR